MSRKVTIRALNTIYKTTPFYSAPRKDAKGEYMLGLSHLPKEYHNSGYVVSPDDRPVIKHSMILDLGSEKDICLYHYLLDVEEVANSLREYNPGKHLFYIEDIEKEAADRVMKDEQMLKAFSLIEKHGDSESFANILIFNKTNPDNLSPVLIKEKVYDLCKKNPENVIEAFSHEAKYIVMLNKAVFKRIVVKKHTNFYYGDILLGTNINQAVSFLMDSKNQKVVDEIGYKLLDADGKRFDRTKKELIKFLDGTEKECTEEEIDGYLKQNNLKVNKMYGIKGKANKLNSYFEEMKKLGVTEGKDA